MADNNTKNPNEKQPGEKPDGTYHFNPGNQSGKSQSVPEDQREPMNKSDTVQNPDKRRQE